MTIYTRTRRQQIGDIGEEVAAEYVLDVLQMRLLARRARVPHGEIDIIARQGNAYVFIEVRTRSSSFGIYPYNVVGGHKRMVLVRSARLWQAQRQLANAATRYDLITIRRLPKDQYDIRHWPAFIDPTENLPQNQNCELLPTQQPI